MNMFVLPGYDRLSSRLALSTLIALCMTEPSGAALDLRNATVETLDNGMTIILLEDRNFPVASVQMLYRVGARNENVGQAGIAHFVEHMAFRASKNFPDTELVSRIYARGGEWHGYTWTDETTYFATVPKNDLDLLLRIEADRMQNLVIAADDMDAERGAVLAEMHMYENDPTSMLIDALMFTSFLAHPYRNNTIGWQSDIENLRHADVVDFYEQHYHPANAVLAVVGDFRHDKVRARIVELFGSLPAGKPTPLPHTVEPLQSGERRIRVHGATGPPQFMIAYRAPSSRSTDHAAFLVLQELLGNGSGVNFRQNDWGTPVGRDGLLSGAAEALTSWYPPSAQDYVFVIGGQLPQGVTESSLERRIEKRVALARTRAASEEELAAAIADVQDALFFDVQTTEDAAHQLAFFAGLGALERLLALPRDVAAVSSERVRQLADHYLQPSRRTLAWYSPDAEPAAALSAPLAARSQSDHGPPTAIDDTPIPQPQLQRLGGGMPVIVQPSDLSPTAVLQVVYAEPALAGPGIARNAPIPGHSSLSYQFQRDALSATLQQASADARSISRAATHNTPSPDPATRLDQVFESWTNREAPVSARPVAPMLMIVAGDVDPDAALRELGTRFGTVAPSASATTAAATGVAVEDRTVHLDVPVAHAQLGYIVPAPAPDSPSADAHRLLLYVLSHDYEGRLGREAITRRGLAYYIDARYRSNGTDGWITLAIGVDPGKLSALDELLRAELARLATEPPTAAEIEEAKTHLLGRARSAAQSNAELAEALSVQWLWHGDIDRLASLQRRLRNVSYGDVIAAVPAFSDGAVIRVLE